jgi:hypothetical protein
LGKSPEIKQVGRRNTLPSDTGCILGEFVVTKVLAANLAAHWSQFARLWSSTGLLVISSPASPLLRRECLRSFSLAL